MEDVRGLWDFDDPAKSEAVFRERLATADGDWRRILVTQIARSLGLQRRFDAAHATLNELESASEDGVRWAHPPFESEPLSRWQSYALLERGRIYNSSGDKDAARPYFRRAAEADFDDLRIDAIHMLAIVAEPDEALALNEQAIREAQTSADPAARRWLGSLLNNTAWSYHDLGRFDRALELFVQALEFRLEQGDAGTIRIAKWCVARCLRSLGRIDDALAMQQELAIQGGDGYVDEEIAECLLVKGDAEAARPYFARAHASLSQDVWLSEREPERIARLDRLAR